MKRGRAGEFYVARKNFAGFLRSVENFFPRYVKIGCRPGLHPRRDWAGFRHPNKGGLQWGKRGGLNIQCPITNIQCSSGGTSGGEADADEAFGCENRRAEGEAVPLADGLRGEGVPVGAGERREARGGRRECVEPGQVRRRGAKEEESRERRRPV